jgi:hypothetical protein
MYLLKLNYQHVFDECISYYILKSKMGDKNKPMKRSSSNNLNLKKIDPNKEGNIYI